MGSLPSTDPTAWRGSRSPEQDTGRRMRLRIRCCWARMIATTPRRRGSCRGRRRSWSAGSAASRRRTAPTSGGSPSIGISGSLEVMGRHVKHPKPGAEALGTFFGASSCASGPRASSPVTSSPSKLRCCAAITCFRGRDPKFVAGFDEVFRSEGVNVIQRRSARRRPNASCGPREPKAWTEPALIGEMGHRRGTLGVARRRCAPGVDPSSRSAVLVTAGRSGSGEACPHDLRELAPGPEQGSPSTKKVGVAWTPARRPPTMSARTRARTCALEGPRRSPLDRAGVVLPRRAANVRP